MITLEDKRAYALEHVGKQVEEASKNVQSQEAWVANLESDLETQRARLMHLKNRLEAMQGLLEAAHSQWARPVVQ